MSAREQLVGFEPYQPPIYARFLWRDGRVSRVNQFMRDPLKYFDPKPHLHINEPVIASLIATPKGSVRLHKVLFEAVFGQAVEQAAVAVGGDDGKTVSNIGQDLFDTTFGPVARRSKDLSKVVLPKVMYMAIGPTKFGLFQVGVKVLGGPYIAKKILLIPRRSVTEFSLGEEPQTFGVAMYGIHIKFDDGTLLELESWFLGMKERGEKIRSVLMGTNP